MSNVPRRSSFRRLESVSCAGRGGVTVPPAPNISFLTAGVAPGLVRGSDLLLVATPGVRKAGPDFCLTDA